MLVSRKTIVSNALLHFHPSVLPVQDRGVSALPAPLAPALIGGQATRRRPDRPGTIWHTDSRNQARKNAGPNPKKWLTDSLLTIGSCLRQGGLNGLENRCTRERTVGSNPTPSANLQKHTCFAVGYTAIND